MRILFVADLHYTLKQFDWVVAAASRFDWVIIGGDLLDLGGALEAELQIVVVEKYLQRIRRQGPLIVCSGNHDGNSRNAANESVATWLHKTKAEGLFVDGDSLQLPHGLFTVCPWWDGEITRLELEQLLSREATKRTGRWVWIHHAPPNRSPVSWTGSRDAGDAQLRAWIEQFGPDLVLSGHIHNAPFYAQGSWMDTVGGTCVLNPGRQIGPVPTFLSLDLHNLTATWVSMEGEESRPLREPTRAV